MLLYCTLIGVVIHSGYTKSTERIQKQQSRKTKTMARLNKNGILSGALGKIVFVNRAGEAHVRLRSSSSNQSKNSEASAKGFGVNSSQDSLVRHAITEKLYIRNYQCFAVNHRTRLRLTILESKDQEGNIFQRYHNPQALVGTVFNNQWQWERATSFYPEYNLAQDHTMRVALPEINLGKQIKLPKNSTHATLNFHAFTIDPNSRSVVAEILSSLSFNLEKNKNIPAQDWVFSIPNNAYWAIIIATISYTSYKNNIPEEHKHTGTYLWAKKIAED